MSAAPTHPHEPEAEATLIGCVLMDAGIVLPFIAETLPAGAESFYDLRHAEIFKAACEIFDAKAPVDEITVSSRLRLAGQLENCGGIPRLAELVNNAVSAHDFPHHAALVHAAHVRRRMLAACGEIASQAHGGGEIDALLESAEVKILAIRVRRATRRTMRELIRATIDRIEQRWERGGTLAGIPTGFAELDNLTDGLEPGDLIVPAAFPSVGKTSLVLNIAEHVAIGGTPVGIISLEMSATQLTTRMLCTLARVNLKDLNRKLLSQREQECLASASARLASAPIHIVEGCTSLTAIKAEARRMVQQHGVKVLCVDYLQLIEPEAAKGANREQEVARISKALKSLAMELQIPVIAPSQLNDDGKLRESRAIGQDADKIWMLEPDAKNQTETSGLVNLWLRKNRNGARDVSVPLTFLKTITRFESASRISEDDMPNDNRSPTND